MYVFRMFVPSLRIQNVLIEFRKFEFEMYYICI